MAFDSSNYKRIPMVARRNPETGRLELTELGKQLRESKDRGTRMKAHIEKSLMKAADNVLLRCAGNTIRPEQTHVGVILEASSSLTPHMEDKGSPEDHSAFSVLVPIPRILKACVNEIGMKTPGSAKKDVAELILEDLKRQGVDLDEEWKS